MDEKSPHAVLVLAAGASRRMGQPKQLLAVDGVPLLRRVVQAAIDAKLGRVGVVLGANAEKVRPALDGLPVEVVVNDAWEEGMGASIRTGMTAFARDPGAWQGVIIALGDQPKISSAYLCRLARTSVTAGKSIVASRFAGKLSPPVWFAPVHFPALRVLQGEAGAKGVLQANPAEIAVIDTDDLGDLDTPEDYADFIHRGVS